MRVAMHLSATLILGAIAGCNLPPHDEHKHVSEQHGIPGRPKPSEQYHVDSQGNRLPVNHGPTTLPQ